MMGGARDRRRLLLGVGRARAAMRSIVVVVRRIGGRLRGDTTPRVVVVVAAAATAAHARVHSDDPLPALRLDHILLRYRPQLRRVQSRPHASDPPPPSPRDASRTAVAASTPRSNTSRQLFVVFEGVDASRLGVISLR